MLTRFARTTLLAATAAVTFLFPAREGFANAQTAPRSAITNVYAGQSTIRIANPGSTAARHEIEIYGVGDHASLGRFVLEVPAKASITFKPETMIPTFAPVNWDQFLVLYVDTAAEGQLWQHVRQYPNDGPLNASLCGPVRALSAERPQMAFNVLTDRAPGIASFVTLHNPSSTPLNLDARVYNASTGRLVGAFAMTVGAHETVNRSGHYFQSTAGWFFPDAADFNVEFVARPGESAADLIVGHSMVDLITGDRTNLADPCPVKARTTAAAAR